jgi:hypothetical protein
MAGSDPCSPSVQFECFGELGKRVSNFDGLPWFHTYQWNHLSVDVTVT